VRLSANRNAFIRAFSGTASLKSADKIEVTLESNGVKRIVINRPEAKNALSFGVRKL